MQPEEMRSGEWYTATSKGTYIGTWVFQFDVIEDGYKICSNRHKNLDFYHCCDSRRYLIDAKQIGRLRTATRGEVRKAFPDRYFYLAVEDDSEGIYISSIPESKRDVYSQEAIIIKRKPISKIKIV